MKNNTRSVCFLITRNLVPFILTLFSFSWHVFIGSLKHPLSLALPVLVRWQYLPFLYLNALLNFDSNRLREKDGDFMKER